MRDGSSSRWSKHPAEGRGLTAIGGLPYHPPTQRHPASFLNISGVQSMVTLGVILGNRGFFPAHLCESGRKQILATLAREGIKAVLLPTEATTYGAVESLSDSRQCAEVFKANREEIDGVLVTLPNFGDERGVANALRWSGLNVPVLVHAFNDDPEKMTIKDRRDSFCGKLSVCNNLRQY